MRASLVAGLFCGQGVAAFLSPGIPHPRSLSSARGVQGGCRAICAKVRVVAASRVNDRLCVCLGAVRQE
jgi:hypothetical protein